TGPQPGQITALAVNAQDHFSEEWRLRSSQIIAAVCIKDFAVTANLVQKVVDHVPGQLDLAIAKQPDLNEVAVPPIHLVESASCHHVRMGKIEEPLLFNLKGVCGQFEKLDGRKVRGTHSSPERSFYAAEVFLRADVPRPAPAGSRRKFRVDCRLSQARVGTRQIAPAVLDVLPYRLKLFGAGTIRR